ncbi:M3 family metallopeptidase [Kitasatospora sp. NPDC056731]|uniref:M3 family metallopeptidase n=1 Tax=Kitasatospora sp. NPDC056731 TaxID=3155422 RepID=UPI0034411288
MTTDQALNPRTETLATMQESLAGMMARLQALVGWPALGQDDLVEIIAVYNNVAYLFLYLESNERHIDFQPLLHWRDAFYDDPALDAALKDRLQHLRCSDPEAEESRLLFLAKLEEKQDETRRSGQKRLDALNAGAKSLISRIGQDQRGLLRRLGIDQENASPQAVFYRIVSATEDTGKREKLTAAWTVLRDRRQGELGGIVDSMVGELRDQSRARGHRTVLAETLQRCRVSEDQVEDFLARYMEQSIVSYRELKEEIGAAVGASGDLIRDPIDHFGYYLRTVIGSRTVPQLPLDGCLEFITEIVRKVFGLTLSRSPASDLTLLTFRVLSAGQEIGTINCDLWDADGKALRANHTKGIRNRTDWSGIVQRPVAHVSCRFTRDGSGADRITFQNAHSLFHELGHAVNHLLIRKRISNQSGLDYLPLERLEYLSMWFEKWVFHPALADRLDLTDEERDGLELCRTIKRLEYRRTYLDRAVTAALDFDLHRHTEGGLAESFARLDSRFGIGVHCALGDFTAYFTWPMLQANPGAYFSYLWGAADSAEKFAEFHETDLNRIPTATDAPDRFAVCFDFDLPTEPPPIQPAFAFYDGTR